MRHTTFHPLLLSICVLTQVSRLVIPGWRTASSAHAQCRPAKEGDR